MEGKGRGAAADNEAEAVSDGGLEAYRDFVVEGEIYQALDLSRRLLQFDGDHARRAGAAQLVLERLRSNRDDSGDHANALLRVLANYATPTKELTEELLSLLFFSEHRVQIIHHLSKLTYQSRECVWLVVDAYIELLSSDRSLLVPILGSLADLPLIAADKSLVIDATESLLDAASEEDVPAVVQSLLSMLVPAAAPRIISKIRGQCNRLLASPTLSLTFEVIMRHVVTGSGALTAFLRAIRQSDALTPFDVIFLALLLSRPSENNVAVRVVASLATRGTLNRHAVQETLKSLRDQKWHEALRCCIRFASAMLTACFNAYRSAGVSSTVQCAVDVLGYLVLYRTIAQEEALSLMMSMVSQPQRLLLSTSKKRYISTSQSLCWDVAHSIAAQLAHIAKTQPASLAPYAHIFLDHLYGIVASSNQPTSHGSGDDKSSSYPASILASLCGTMVALTKLEPGMVSLLMITIQKQLVVPIQAVPSGITTINRSQASAAVQLKQLMAVFLAGEMLVQGVGEKQDRSSLLGWVQKLLTSAAMSDETTTHVVRLLGSKNIVSSLSTADRETTTNLLSAVLARIGFEMKSQKSVASRLHSTPTQQIDVEYLPGLSDQGTSWVATSLVFDAITYVRTARLGEEPVGWRTLFDSELSSSIARSVEISILAKTELLPVLMEAFWRLPSKLSTESDTQDDRAYVCSFALPSVSEDTFGENLSSTLWCYACALQLAVGSTNSLSIKQQTRTTDGKLGAKSMSETVRQRKRLLNRVQVCWTLHKRLRALLDEASSRLKRMAAEHGQRDAPLLAWRKLQIDIIEKQLTDNAIWESSSWVRLSLCSLGERLSLQAVSAVFEGLWKQHASTIESGLEIELFRAFPARLRIQAGDGDLCTDQLDKHLGFEAMEALVSTQDGRRTLKYLARRVFDYCELLASLGEDNVNTSDDQDLDAHHTRHWVLTGVRTLCTALQSIIEVCRTQQLQRAMLGLGEPDEVWEDTVLELFAKGASDIRIRRIGNKRSTSWSTSCEIIFRSLASALVQSKDGEVVCEIVGVLLSLTGHTRRTVELSQLCLSLLHCPYPSTNKFPSSTAVKAIRKLPVLDPATSTAITDLLRPMPRKFHHLSLFIIGAWAIPSTVSTGLNHVSYLLECADALVSSSITARQSSKADTMRFRQLDKKKVVRGEPDDEDDIDGWIARDGEHRVLKNLTHDTLPVFVESILACLATAPLRAVPSPATDLRSDTNPFFDLIGVIAAVSKCLQAFVAAEMNGFNLPQRTSITVLRSGPAISQNVEQAITACVEWREEGFDGKSRSHGGSFGDLQYLFEAANGAVATIEDVAISFQERVVVTMQKKAQPQASSMGDEDDGKRNSSGRWGNELIHKTYRSQFQRRKALSKSEAKLLPYFTHSAERLKAFVTEIAGKYGCELAPEDSADSLSRSLQSIRLGDDQLDAVLALLAPGDSVVDVDALDNDPMLELTWSRLNSAEEGEQALEEKSEDQSDDDEVGDGEGGFEDDGQLSQRSDPPQLQHDTRLGTKRTDGRVHTLIPQKKRVKLS